MAVEFVLKVVIPDPVEAGCYTLYLFSHINKILLPVKTNRWGCESILLVKQKKQYARPHIYNTTLRSIKALGADVKCVFVYKVIEDIFYVYIRILRNNKFYDIDAKMSDALGIAALCNAPVLVSSNVYEKVGIKVTPDLIERSLRNLS
jgi:uncharacterized protein